MFMMTFIGSIINEKTATDYVNYLKSLLTGNHKYNTITFCSSDKDVSQRYRALMNYISQTCDPSVKNLFEIELKKYNHRTDSDETHSSVYRVSQATKFKIINDIYGRVYWSSKDKTEYNGKVSYVEYQNLEIGSNKKTMNELIKWIDQIDKNYKEFLKSKMLDTQTLVQVEWDSKDDYINAFYTPWSSNVTFKNRFFTDKDEIIKKIDFFLNNEQWYKDRGIPYTLGILLWGEPGCGKTGFIKALMNYTKRHGIDIKLNEKFDMGKLKEVICDDQITDDIIIPQKNRILLFEDIDAMGTVVKSRDLESDKDDSKSDENETHKQILEILKKSQKNKNNDDICFVETKSSSGDNNNMSYFLNILDGLNECPGRIVIMTTNRKKYLDKALIRPGRIDIMIHMTKATINDINNILNFYWSSNKKYDINNEWEQKLSHADVISCCRQSNSALETINKIEQTIKEKEIEEEENKKEKQNKKLYENDSDSECNCDCECDNKSHFSI